MIEPTAITRNLTCWSDDNNLTIKVIDVEKGYWAETKLDKNEAFHLIKLLNMLDDGIHDKIYRLEFPEAIGKNLIVTDLGRDRVAIRIADYRRNYWAEMYVDRCSKQIYRLGEIVKTFLGNDIAVPNL